MLAVTNMLPGETELGLRSPIFPLLSNPPPHPIHLPIQALPSCSAKQMLHLTQDLPGTWPTFFKKRLPRETVFPSTRQLSHTVPPAPFCLPQQPGPGVSPSSSQPLLLASVQSLSSPLRRRHTHQDTGTPFQLNVYVKFHTKGYAEKDLPGV